MLQRSVARAARALPVVLAIAATTAVPLRAQVPVLEVTRSYYGCATTGDCFSLRVALSELPPTAGANRAGEEALLVDPVVTRRTAFDFGAICLFCWDFGPGSHPGTYWLAGGQLDYPGPFGSFVANYPNVLSFRAAWTTDPANPAPPGGAGWTVEQITFAAIPEPSTVALFATGGLGLAGVAARRRRAQGSA
jgi:hypothetical protein